MKEFFLVNAQEIMTTKTMMVTVNTNCEYFFDDLDYELYKSIKKWFGIYDRDRKHPCVRMFANHNGFSIWRIHIRHKKQDSEENYAIDFCKMEYQGKTRVHIVIVNKYEEGKLCFVNYTKEQVENFKKEMDEDGLLSSSGTSFKANLLYSLVGK